MVRFSLNIKTCCLYGTWEIHDQIWAKIICIPQIVNSRTPMKMAIIISHCHFAYVAFVSSLVF